MVTANNNKNKNNDDHDDNDDDNNNINFVAWHRCNTNVHLCDSMGNVFSAVSLNKLLKQ